MHIKQGYKTALYWTCFAMIVVFAAYNSFWGLDNGVIYDWDEARQGVNAYEMAESGDYVVNTFGGEPDYWNVKPPLSFWQTALSFRLFGYNMLGLRFFSALWLPVIALSAMLFLKKYCGAWASLSAGAILACLGMRFHHLFRTGDPDSLFFMCCFFTCMCLYLSYVRNSKYLIGAGLWTSFAFLSKAMHVFPLLIVLAASLFLLRREKAFGRREVLACLLPSMALPALAWAVLRFSRDGTVFFRHMLELDVWNRVTSVVENHSGGFGYYFAVLYNLLGGALFGGMLLTLILSLFYAVTKLGTKADPRAKPHERPEAKARSGRVFLVIYGLMLAAPLAVFTLSKTKLGWYMYPCMIGFSFLTAWALQSFADDFSDRKQRGTAAALGAICAVLLTLGVLWKPFDNIDMIASAGYSSENSIFADLYGSGIEGYYVIGLDGNEASVPQSWLLHSYFLGMSHFRGDYGQYTRINETHPGTFLIVNYSDPGELEAFRSSHADLSLVARRGAYAAFVNNAGNSEPD